MGSPPTRTEEETMAMKVPDVLSLAEVRALARKKPRKARAEEDGPSLFRLAEHHRETLRDVAEGVEESDAGLCCSYLFDSSGGEGRDYDETALLAAESFAEAALTFDFLAGAFGAVVVSSWRERLRRSRRAITLLRSEGKGEVANVLMVAYGHPDPFAREVPELVALGRAGSLARYTEVVEERRRELVRETAKKDREKRRFVDVRSEDGELVRPPGLLPGDRYREGGDLRSLVLEEPDAFADAVDFAHRRDLRAAADAAISSTDAIRAALVAFGEPIVEAVPGESYAQTEGRRLARKERSSAHALKRKTFLTELRLEVARTLSSAEEAYHDAWLRSASPRAIISSAEPGYGRPAPRHVDLEPSTAARARGAGWSTT